MVDRCKVYIRGDKVTYTGVCGRAQSTWQEYICSRYYKIEADPGEYEANICLMLGRDKINFRGDKYKYIITTTYREGFINFTYKEGYYAYNYDGGEGGYYMVTRGEEGGVPS